MQQGPTTTLSAFSTSPSAAEVAMKFCMVLLRRSWLNLPALRSATACSTLGRMAASSLARASLAALNGVPGRFICSKSRDQVCQLSSSSLTDWPWQACQSAAGLSGARVVARWWQQM